MLFFYYTFFDRIFSMKFTHSKRFYLIIMIALTILCVVKAFQHFFQQNLQEDRTVYLSLWILLSFSSAAGSIYAYMKVFHKKESLRFGEVYH